MLEGGEESAVGDGVAGEAEETVEAELAGDHAVGDGPAELAVQDGLMAGEVPFLAEAGKAAELPVLAPALEVEGAVGFADGFRNYHGHHGAGIHPDRSAKGLDAEAEVHIFGNAGDGGIEEVGSAPEEIHPHEESVHFDMARGEGGVAVEGTPGFSLVVGDDELAASACLVDAGFATGHMGFFLGADPLAVERRGGGSVFIDGGFEEAVEPAGFEEDIVVHERGEFGVDVGKGELFGFVREEEVFNPYVAEVRSRTGGEELAAVGRRAAIDINYGDRLSERAEERLQARAGEIKTFALGDHNRGGGRHGWRLKFPSAADKGGGFEGFEVAESRDFTADQTWDEAGDFFKERPPAGMGDRGEVDGFGGETGVGFEAVEAGIGREGLASGAEGLDFGAGDEGAGGFEIQEVRGMPFGVRAAPMHVQAVAEAVPFEDHDVGDEFARAEDSMGFQSGRGFGGFAESAPMGFGGEARAALASPGQQGAVHGQAKAAKRGPIEVLDAAMLRGFFNLLAELALEGVRAIIFIAEDEGVCGESRGAGGGR